MRLLNYVIMVYDGVQAACMLHAGCQRSYAACLRWYAGCLQSFAACIRWNAGCMQSSSSLLTTVIRSYAGCIRSYEGCRRPYAVCIRSYACCMQHACRLHACCMQPAMHPSVNAALLVVSKSWLQLKGYKLVTTFDGSNDALWRKDVHCDRHIGKNFIQRLYHPNIAQRRCIGKKHELKSHSLRPGSLTLIRRRANLI
jgi:hypothetical protein